MRSGGIGLRTRDEDHTVTDLPFIDPHVHLWHLGNIRYPWLSPPFNDDGPNGSVESIAHNYLLDDYLAESVAWHPAAIVHVEAGAHAEDSLRETAWLQRIADQHQIPMGIVAFAALNDPDLERKLDLHAQHSNLRGIRHIVNWHPDAKRTYTPRDVTGDQDWQRGFALLAKYGLSFDLQAYPGQFARLAALGARHDDVAVIINHTGMPVDTDNEGLAVWRSGMKALAALPRAALKISGLGFVHRSWKIEQIRPIILEAIEIFGVSRCMFASDFPTDRLFGDFNRHLEAYHEIVADFTPDERKELFACNAARIYRLKGSSGPTHRIHQAS